MRALLAATAIVATLLAHRAAHACDCGTGEPSVADARAQLATVVAGRVIAVSSGTAGYQVDLFVGRAWKGATAGTVITIPIDASSCGYFLVPGDDVLIYAPARGPVQQCAGGDTARVRTGADVDADAAALGPPVSATVTPSAVTLAAPDVIVEATVKNVERTGRLRLALTVTRARHGARRKQQLEVWSPIGGCAVIPPAIGSRVAVRATTVHGVLLATPCAGADAVRTLRARP